MGVAVRVLLAALVVAPVRRPRPVIRRSMRRPQISMTFLTMAQEHDLHFLAMRDKSHLVDS